MSIKMMLAAATTAIVFCAAPGIVQAASIVDEQESVEDRTACADDAMQHCGNFVPDRQRVYDCLVQKVKLISPACRKVITRPTRR
jgi:hypothetical protein